MHLEQTWESENTVAAACSAHYDRGVREDGARRAGAASFTVTVEHDGDVHVVTVDREVPTQGPSAMKKVLGETSRIVQTERWHEPDADGISRAEITVAFPGKPVSMTAEAVIEPTASGSAERVSGELKVKVPVVGRVIEPEIVKQITHTLRVEMDVGLAWLAAR